ncbi:hypothetical protein O181_004529 [Austropuccinia psidii MF-1]|uniref:Uncharacterized protein n=1 Tax=Austropuccinia psidii MF-1 TaxID=1389203 RepID=A0A9Q3GEY7_9BASI|nr:hypothetical protein [Austropuccinia psidii MF-1]
MSHPFQSEREEQSLHARTTDRLLYDDEFLDDFVGPSWMARESQGIADGSEGVEPESARLELTTRVEVETNHNNDQIQVHLNSPKKNKHTPRKNAVNGLLDGLDGPSHITRTASQSSSSSLEPLSEAFEFHTPLSPLPDFAQLPTQPKAKRPSQLYPDQAEAEYIEQGRLHRRLSSQKSPARRHQRAKSDTPVELNTVAGCYGRRREDDDSGSLASSHFHRKRHPERREPTSVPPSPAQCIASLGSPLIADVNVAKSRLLVTKTHCFYPPISSLIPFSSCLLGFQLVFHSSDPKARIKHSQIKLTTFAPFGGPPCDIPIIKAIYPTQGVIHKTGDRTFVQRRDENSIGVKLGVDPYGAMILSHTHSRSQEHYTSPYLLGSGIETNKLLITLNEDSTLHHGVPPSLSFAILLYLPSKATKAFGANLTIDTSAGKELSASFRKIWASPKVWQLFYDGKTELGSLKIQKRLENLHDETE